MNGPKEYLSILGSTGSIGASTLDVVGRFSDRFQIWGLAAGRNIELLARQTALFHPRVVSVAEEQDAARLKLLLGSQADTRVVWGEDGASDIASVPEVRTVVSAMVGAAGLKPTLAAVSSGKRVALANKETLVVAGSLVMAEAERKGALILPVDSEHSAIFQSLAGQRKDAVKRLILTASGGPFRDWSLKRLERVTVDQALDHPNWNMGAKITVDSATLMNKGLETIEARWLFDLDFDRISVLVHPQSIVHSMVEYVDGSVIAQLGRPDMRMPILYALSYPERLPLDLPGLDLTGTGPLTFEEPDLRRFPCLALAMDVGRRGQTAPALLNAANEVAVEAFLAGRLEYQQIFEVTVRVLENIPTEPLTDLDQVLAADVNARAEAYRIVEDIKGSKQRC